MEGLDNLQYSSDVLSDDDFFFFGLLNGGPRQKAVANYQKNGF